MRIEPERDALLAVDLQHDFLPGGALGVQGGDAIVAPVARLAPRFSTVVATQDWHPRGHVSFASAHAGRRPYETIDLGYASQELWPDHCVQDSPGAAIHPAFPSAPVTLILRKGIRRDVDSYSAFREERDERGARRTTGLGAWLHARGISSLHVVGLARDYCVRASAVDAVAEGFDALVIDSLTRAVWPERRDETDRALASAGVQRRLSP
jgi:nicotinamidase/pyrazinamidase